MMRTRRFMVAGVGTAALILGLASVSWACSPSPPSQTVAPPVGAAGSTVTVSGSNFAPAPVTIHWNDASGPALATTRGPAFSIPVTIPAGAAVDVFYIVAVGQAPSGDQLQVAQTFEVTSGAGGGMGVSQDLWSGFESGKDVPAPSDYARPAGNDTSGLAIGVGLLSLGAVALVGSFALAGAGRRKVRVGATSHTD